MKHLSPSLTKNSPTWFGALALGAVGNFSGILAVFMPMKSVLILASGEVPGFFPRALVDGGAVFASLVLLFAAGILGLVAWAASQAIAALDRGPCSTDTGDRSFAGLLGAALREARATRNGQTSAVLILLVAAVLVAVSPAYFGFSIVFICASFFTVLWRVLHPSNESAHLSGVDQLTHELSFWLRSSATWSGVGLALLTLLVAPPTLGPTAILIAAVFGRRFSITVAELLPGAACLVTEYAIPMAKPGIKSLVANKPTGVAVTFPMDYLSSVPGERRLGAFLSDAGFAEGDFRVVGTARRQVVSLIAGPREHSQLLLRVFGRQHQEAQRLELVRRLDATPASPYPRLHTEPRPVAGLPSLVVRLEDDAVRLDPDGEVSQEDIVRFQLRHELESITYLATQQSQMSPILLSEDVLVGALERAARIPGGHARACLSLIPELPAVFRVIESLPLSVVPSKPLTSRECYPTVSGHPAYLGGVKWGIGRPGDGWGKTSRYEKSLKAVRKEGSWIPVETELILLNAHLAALHRKLLSWELKDVESNVLIVKKRMDVLA